MIVGAYGRYLTYLGGHDLLSPDDHAADRLRPDLVRSYLIWLRPQVASRTVCSEAQNLLRLARAVEPAIDWAWLRAIVNELERRAVPATPVLPRLRAPRAIIKAALDYLTKVETHPGWVPHRRASRYRDGLLLVLLAARPLRLRNVSEIRIGEHLVRDPQGWALRFSGAETKNGRPFEVPMPAMLERFVGRYLAIYRPILLGNSTTDALWVATGGAAMSASSVLQRLTKISQRILGVRMSTRILRHCLATAGTDEIPEGIRVVALLLGHTQLATAERHYVHARMDRAVRAHTDLIADLRKRLPIDWRAPAQPGQTRKRR